MPLEPGVRGGQNRVRSQSDGVNRWCIMHLSNAKCSSKEIRRMLSSLVLCLVGQNPEMNPLPLLAKDFLYLDDYMWLLN